MYGTRTGGEKYIEKQITTGAGVVGSGYGGKNFFDTFLSKKFIMIINSGLGYGSGYGSGYGTGYGSGYGTGSDSKVIIEPGYGGDGYVSGSGYGNPDSLGAGYGSLGVGGSGSGSIYGSGSGTYGSGYDSSGVYGRSASGSLYGPGYGSGGNYLSGYGEGSSAADSPLPCQTLMLPPCQALIQAVSTLSDPMTFGPETGVRPDHLWNLAVAECTDLE